MAINEDEQEGIVFLHRVMSGCIGRSFGVHVAKLAGMPSTIVRRADEVLRNLEHQASEGGIRAQDGLEPSAMRAPRNGNGLRAGDLQVVAPARHHSWQSEQARLVAQALAHDPGAGLVLDTIDLFAITPLDALNLLYMLQQRRKEA